MFERDVVEEASGVVEFDSRHVLEDDDARERDGYEPESGRSGAHVRPEESDGDEGRSQGVEGPRRLALVRADGA